MTNPSVAQPPPADGHRSGFLEVGRPTPWRDSVLVDHLADVIGRTLRAARGEQIVPLAALPPAEAARYRSLATEVFRWEDDAAVAVAIERAAQAIGVIRYRGADYKTMPGPLKGELNLMACVAVRALVRHLQDRAPLSEIDIVTTLEHEVRS